MIRNYIIIAWRVLWNNKVFSFINIVGLAIGMAAALILLHYVRFEKSYDAFHEKVDNIYRVNFAYEMGDESGIVSTNNPGCGPMLKEEIPEVIEYVRFFDHSRNSKACIISYQLDDKTFRKFNEDQEKVFFTDASVFTIFSFPLVKGNPETALKEPYSIALSETTARKYFGDMDPVGKILHIEDWSNKENKNYLVTGVFKDIPVNSHLQFNILLSFATLNANAGTLIKNYDTWWQYPEFTNYILLRENSNPKNIELISQPLFEKYMVDFLVKAGHSIGENFKMNFPLQSVKSIYLSDISISNLAQKSDIKKLHFLIIIAIMIIFIACINYINLSTAKAAKRAKEVGLRKVIGADRKQLISQFFTESILINVFAIIIAITILQLAASPFNQLIQKEVFTYEMFDLRFVGIIVSILAGCVFTAGIYPAIFLSSYRPAMILKGNFHKSVKGISARNILVIIQFTASVMLISGIYAVSRQLSFMNRQDLGFEKEQVLALIVPTQQDYITRLESFKQELLKNSQTINVSNSNYIPGIKNLGDIFKRYTESENNLDQKRANSGCQYFAVDPDYLNTFDI
ncbi:MAG: ABC transporter permease, partial [Cyclobacteriaceae bacterium]|nr:ABC transporter permease [Cyclobacteriaceae bacterium]